MPPQNKAISVALAMALAQAALGFPGTDMYFVANYEPNASGSFDIAGAFFAWPPPDPSDQKRVDDGTAGWFGPYSNTILPVNEGQETVGQMQITPQAPTGGGGQAFTLYPIQFPGFTVPPGDTAFPGPFDAAFLSAAAIQKFAVPYYAALYGAAYALTLQQQFNTSDLALMVHMPWSEYGTLSGTGQPGPDVVGDGGQHRVADGIVLFQKQTTEAGVQYVPVPQLPPPPIVP